MTDDLEKKREYARQWRAANPERIREYRRRYNEANKERNRERARERYRANPEERREKMRRYRQANPEKVRENNRRSRLANHEREIERQRLNRASGYRTPRQREHAATVERFWREQGGCCYLCEAPLALEVAVLEHDHQCCPKQNTSCSYCVRGAACTQCNTAIGLLRDNPDLLERVARNLRTKLGDMEHRLAAKPVQAMLDVI